MNNSQDAFTHCRALFESKTSSTQGLYDKDFAMVLTPNNRNFAFGSNRQENQYLKPKN